MNWDTVQWAFTTNEIGNWHPLTWISLLFDAQTFGLSPSGFHSMNTVYHLLNAWLLYGLLLYATKAPFRSFLVAFLFAVHPLHVESVAWISGRKDLISTSLVSSPSGRTLFIPGPKPRKESGTPFC
ncbi:MAG: hypothetical protein R3C11_16555 [Planctomycetaceae bacterium]